MKIVKYTNENKRELELNEKGDITELIVSEYIIRFDDKEEYEKVESIILEAVKLGFDVYHSNDTASKLFYEYGKVYPTNGTLFYEYGKVYPTNGTLVSFIENKNSHELKEIIRKILTTTK